jgi:hypothetical protein
MCRPMVWASAPWIAGGAVARMTASTWYWPSGNDGSRSTKLSTRWTPGCVASQRLRRYSSAIHGAASGEAEPKSRTTGMRVVSWPGNSRRTSSSPRRDSARRSIPRRWGGRIRAKKTRAGGARRHRGQYSQG